MTTTIGKSGGFLADPIDEDYSDLSLSVRTQLRSGIEGIVFTTEKYDFPCDLQVVPSIYAARKPEHVSAVEKEYLAWPPRQPFTALANFVYNFFG